MMSLEDDDLFKNAMEDVTPLKNCADIHWLKAPVTKFSRQSEDEAQLDNPLTRGFLTVIPRAVPLEYKVAGIQQGVLDKLRLGKYPLDASLNLLRQPIETCRQSLWCFMREAQQNNFRNLLIIHGKGREDDAHPNIVRSYLARWLPQFEEVQVFCHAQLHHGGSGACYVGLRKSEQARRENRERHARRQC